MSTKIYYAWRTPIREFNKFLADYRAGCFAKAAAEVRELADRQTPDEVRRHYRLALGKRRLSGEDADFVLANEGKIRATMVLVEATQASRSPYRSVFGLDCFLTVFLRGRYAYAIGRGDIVPDVPYQNYCYYNNTDRPEDVSAREWASRRKVWNELCDRWGQKLIQSVVDLKEGVGTFEIARAMGFSDDDASWVSTSVAIRSRE